jgi:hypothetical protein
MSEMMKRLGATILLAETEWSPKSGVPKESAMARAALLALLDPTHAMIEAGGEQPYVKSGDDEEPLSCGHVRDVIAVENIWRAMIEAEIPEE